VSVIRSNLNVRAADQRAKSAKVSRGGTPDAPVAPIRFGIFRI
jgi:hypothetical protein